MSLTYHIYLYVLAHYDYSAINGLMRDGDDIIIRCNR